MSKTESETMSTYHVIVTTLERRCGVMVEVQSEVGGDWVRYDQAVAHADSWDVLAEVYSSKGLHLFANGRSSHVMGQPQPCQDIDLGSRFQHSDLSSFWRSLDF